MRLYLYKSEYGSKYWDLSKMSWKFYLELGILVGGVFLLSFGLTTIVLGVF